MRLGGRIQASIEVLEDILDRRTPATMALRDWGKSNRYAGSKDRNAIGNIVHDALRCKSSIAWRMDDDSARALALGAIVFSNHYRPGKIESDFNGDKYAPPKLSASEMKRLEGVISLDDAPEWVRADVPEWIWPAFSNNFADDAVAEGKALSMRPPMDIRVNTLRGDNASAFDALKGFSPQPSMLSPVGLRFGAFSGVDGRHPNVQSEAIYQTGGIEIQDEGSQLISLLINARAGDQILDYCAGGGGKSLALAADMNNDGIIHAFDIDKRRLAPLYQRAQRAGVDMVNICEPPAANLSGLIEKMDKVVVDAPCTGVGTWRRKPDAKWRVNEAALERRIADQAEVLEKASAYVRKQGLLFYMTCSMLAEENEGAVYRFLDEHDEFSLLSAGEVWEERFGTEGAKPWSSDGCSLTLTPASTNTDGFYFAVMEKQ